MDGVHPNCIECRAVSAGACEFDGKLSVAFFRDRFYIYARANLEREHGGRFVQVAVSDGNDPRGPYGEFTLLRIAGYDARSTGNIYFAAVKTNPIDNATLLGLFPVALVENSAVREAGTADGAAGGLDGLIGLSISCNGLDWAPLLRLSRSRVVSNRTVDQPVDGFLVRGSRVFAYLHRNVQWVSRGRRRRNESVAIEPHEIDARVLRRLTQAAHATLNGCTQRNRP